MTRPHTNILCILILGISLTLSRCQEDDSMSCISRINHHRAKYGVTPAITERTDLHSCANRQSQYDKQMGSHKSYKRCGGLGSQGSGGGSTCGGVIDMFFNERWRCTDDAVLFGSAIEFASGDAHNSQRKCRSACMNDDMCLSYGFDSNAAAEQKCRFFDKASLTHVRKVDDAFFFLGAPEQLTTAPSKVDGWRSFSVIDIDGSNTVPVDGTITSFKWYGSNANGVTFYLYRFVSDMTYEVVGIATATGTNVGVENTLATNISVQKGDVMGWTWDGTPAFGFDETNEGHILYTHEEDSGGPANVGDQWTFNKSMARQYHVAASFVPADSTNLSTSSPGTYCAAALCQGHCGPVMSGGTKTFSWGEWNGHYTLNWRPSARLPAGGAACPSGIEAVRCWTDDQTRILWAYGVGGEDCHSTCSLAGAQPSDYMCDENTPITNGFTEVSSIMSNFENPYNDNDSDGFTCTEGTCWNGETSRQISIHEYNSNCYIPSSTTKYTCDARFGNANCFGQRFNQVCPCVRGCAVSAAGPSCAPSSTNSPTIAPVTSNPATKGPTSAPVTSPCKDSPFEFLVTNQKGVTKEKSCEWVRKKKEKRCTKNAFRRSCPSTCDNCSNCGNSKFKFKVMKPNGKEIIRGCNWTKKNTAMKCAWDGVADTCRFACGTC